MYKPIILIIAAVLGPIVCNADGFVSEQEIMRQLSPPTFRSLGSQGFTKGQISKGKGRIDLPAIQFEYNSSILTTPAMEQVNALGAVMLKRPDEKLHIVGHTDASGSDIYNMSLSERRAISVSQYLESELGIAPSRLIAVGEGESRLKNQSDPDSAENRRVEIINTRALGN